MSDLDVFESSLNLEEEHQDAGFEAGLRRVHIAFPPSRTVFLPIRKHASASRLIRAEPWLFPAREQGWQRCWTGRRARARPAEGTRDRCARRMMTCTLGRVSRASRDLAVSTLRLSDATRCLAFVSPQVTRSDSTTDARSRGKSCIAGTLPSSRKGARGLCSSRRSICPPLTLVRPLARRALKGAKALESLAAEFPLVRLPLFPYVHHPHLSCFDRGAAGVLAAAARTAVTCLRQPLWTHGTLSPQENPLDERMQDVLDRMRSKFKARARRGRRAASLSPDAPVTQQLFCRGGVIA